MLVYVAILEAGIIAGSGLDSWVRGDSTTWLRRWLWWHLAPLWFLVLAAAAGFQRCAERWAARSVERYHRADARVLLVEPTAG